MLTLLNYLPYALVAGLIVFIVMIFAGQGDQRRDYRRVLRPQPYRWTDESTPRRRCPAARGASALKSDRHA